MKLYDFQQEDIAKLCRQKSASIESEMAAGKTHEGIALEELWNVEGRKPSLVVAPINTWDTWRDKYEMQSPHTDVVTIDRKNRDGFSELVRKKKGDVFLMHYEALRLMPELAKIPFQVIIADEAHHIANRDSKQTSALKKLHTEYKLAMSGTMSGDQPDNLWSVYNWLWPNYYTSYWRFRRHYCDEIQVWNDDQQKYFSKIVGVKNIASLDEERDPWRVRHLKREQCCPHHPNGIMSYLPDKTYDVIKVDLNPTQRKFYNQMRSNMVAWIGEHEDEPLVAQVVIAKLTRLNQMALATPEMYEAWGWAPFLALDDSEPIINPYTDKVEKYRYSYQAMRLKLPSSKIEAAKGFVQDHSNKTYVIFSSSKQTCYLAQAEFARSGISGEVLSGDTPQWQRDGMVKRFNKGDFQIFFGVIEAAAEGIDGLQHTCDTAIFLDRSWRTIKNQQAEERLDRPGQKNSTQIIDIMARDTEDAGKKTKLELKWSWIKEMLGDK